MTVVEALQRCSLFKTFTPTGLQIMAGIAAERAVPAGAPLFLEGAAGEGLLIVKSGTVRISQRVDGAERELAVLGPGEHLGELALLAPSTRLVSAVAATDCEVVELGQRRFAALQPEKPQACLKLALAVAADLAARVAGSRDLLQGLGPRRPAAGR